MAIHATTTTLWAELARWRTSAHAVITRPEHWAIHGTTRIGKALTEKDRLEPGELDAAGLAASVKCAGSVMDLLTRGDGSSVRWDEAAARDVKTSSEAAAAISAAISDVATVEVAGIEVLVAVSHALQAGSALASGASASEILALVTSEPRIAMRPTGPFAAILALSADTLFVPAPLRSAWDSPACVVASAVALRADLAALPELFRSDQPAPKPLLGAQATVATLTMALQRAGTRLCVRVRG